MLWTSTQVLEGTVIYDGNSNVTFDEGLDKTQPFGGRLTHPSKQILCIAKMIYQQGLVDI